MSRGGRCRTGASSHAWSGRSSLLSCSTSPGPSGTSSRSASDVRSSCHAGKPAPTDTPAPINRASSSAVARCASSSAAPQSRAPKVSSHAGAICRRSALCRRESKNRINVSLAVRPARRDGLRRREAPLAFDDERDVDVVHLPGHHRHVGSDSLAPSTTRRRFSCRGEVVQHLKQARDHPP